MQLTTHPRFGDLLKQRIGLDAGSIGDAAIARAVRLRSTACGAADDAHYWALLQSSPAEVQQLIEAVVVPETWFNRYPESLTALVEVVRARLSRSTKVRILSLPCSTGEEPYSIVMALLDAGIPADSIAVDAVDVSEKVIAFAQRAVYGANSFRGDVAGLRERYFSASPQGEVLARRVAERVSLRAGNLFDPQALAGAQLYDIIFCRNLLIYFDAPTQERALDVLTRATHATGALFVGPAEASLLTRHGLRAMAPHAFGFYVGRAPVAARTVSARATPAAPRLRPGPGAAAPRAPARVHPVAPPAPPVVAPVVASPPDIDGLDALRRLADRGPAADALAACEHWLATHVPAAQVYGLQGMLHDSLGQPRQAEAAYRKALYLEPSHAESLVHLAALLAAQGDLEGARRLHARSARQERRHA
ncbi:CheR family methyltransferase [Variovorax boronicumulans]|uniref:CheR family methyltransferase n=1 Tax=Variovorax boronicumulans TaxID=436515 RepID=UPI001C59D270